MSDRNCVTILNENSLSKKIYKAISQRSVLFVNNSSHSSEPPDFYSVELSVMFDIMRVNDSELKKNYNPTLIAEREMEKELMNSHISKIVPEVKDRVMCIDPDYGSDEIHNIKNYLKCMNRVVGGHLSSGAHTDKIKEIWEKNYPNIRYKGLLVFDETENYYVGYCKKQPGTDRVALCNYPQIQGEFYKPWMDKSVMEKVYFSSCDFLVWAMPYKRYGDLTYRIDPNFPYAVVLDTRYTPSNYIDYDYNIITRI